MSKQEAIKAYIDKINSIRSIDLDNEWRDVFPNKRRPPIKEARKKLIDEYIKVVQKKK